MIKKRTPFFRITALILIVMLICPVCISATEPRASAYLTSYNAYPYSAAWGKVQIWFNVTGTDYLDELGALTVQIYESKDNENFTWVKTFSHDVYTNMLGENDIVYQSHVDYQGTIGRYYKAYVCIWGGRDGGGDTRYFWTTSTKATLFAQ